MKKLHLSFSGIFFFLNLFFLSFLTLRSSAQSPDLISYQAVVRDTAETPITNTTIGLKIEVNRTSSSGTLVFSETHTPTTDDEGLIYIEIGGGTYVSGAVEDIDWGNGPYYTSLYVDVSGGTNYTYMGSSRLCSVPYALYAPDRTRPGNGLEGGSDKDSLSVMEMGGGMTKDISLNLNLNNIFFTHDDSTTAFPGITQQSTNLSGALNMPRSQTFTQNGTNKLFSVTLKVNVQAGTEITVRIKDSSTSITYAQHLFSTAFDGWYEFVFENSPMLHHNSVYSIFLEPAGPNSFWLYSNGNPYLGGTANLGNDNDFGFIIKCLNQQDVLTLASNSFVGIGTNNPTEKLDVNGKIKTTALQIPTGAAAGKTLISDLNGNATWQTLPITYPPSGAAGGDLTGNYPSPTLTLTGVNPGTYNKVSVDNKGRVTAGGSLSTNDITPLETDPKVGTLNVNAVPKWMGNSLTNGQISDNGSAVGIGTNTPLTGTKLDVVGLTRTSNVAITGGAPAANKVLMATDPQGNATWSASNSLPGTLASILSTQGNIGVLIDSTDFRFMPVSLTITVNGTQDVEITATAALGTNSTTNSPLMHKMALGYKSTSGAVFVVDPVSFLQNLKAPVNSRLPYTLNTIFQNIPAGTYTFGMIYQCDAGTGANWNSNDMLRIVAKVFN